MQRCNVLVHTRGTACRVCVNRCVSESLLSVRRCTSTAVSSETEFPPFFLISGKHLWKILVRVFSKEANSFAVKRERKRARERERGSVVAFNVFVKDVLDQIPEHEDCSKGSVFLRGVISIWSIGDHTGISSIKSKDSRLPKVSIRSEIQNCVLKPWLSGERQKGSCADQIYSSSRLWASLKMSDAGKEKQGMIYYNHKVLRFGLLELTSSYNKTYHTLMSKSPFTLDKNPWAVIHNNTLGSLRIVGHKKK